MFNDAGRERKKERETDRQREIEREKGRRYSFNLFETSAKCLIS